MIQNHIVARGICDANVLEAMLRIPRELFVALECREQAYEDKALPIGPGQTISQPYIVAYMTQMLLLEPTHRVLEVGTGTGYQTAILAQLSAQVHTVELDQNLTQEAAKRLAALGLDQNVAFRSGDGVEAWRDAGPFDRILVTAGSPTLPEALMTQLAIGGLMIVPVGRGKTQMMLRLRIRDGVRVEQPLIACRFVPLV
ncbi:MAG TPA: protein-L-isoaspartate(D-aspartate) O-methyltransferase [Phycisphaerae bacterium]|nr:protein-L-isoaspartate(D-aspartate) O-methyltransferase [Phycisphaerae bacterium]